MHVSNEPTVLFHLRWDEGLVMTCISLNLQRIRSLDEIAVAHSGRQHRRAMVVSCIALEGIGAVPSMDEGELGNSPKVRRNMNLALGPW
jgi:hypothetical protein